MSKRAILSVLVLLAIHAFSMGLAYFAGAQYDDRNPILQLVWWLSASWMLVVVAGLIASVSLVKRLMS